jgi:hypothetical protein
VPDIYAVARVRAYGIVTVGLIRQQATQVPFSQHHDVIKARSDQPFHVAILPGTS